MLIIEDGTGVPDAESYATAAELVIYAGKFGVAIPAEEAAQEAVLRRAALVMDGMTWKGRKSTGDQALSWPRREIRLDGENKPERYLRHAFSTVRWLWPQRFMPTTLILSTSARARSRRKRWTAR